MIPWHEEDAVQYANGESAKRERRIGAESSWSERCAHISTFSKIGTKKAVNVTAFLVHQTKLVYHYFPTMTSISAVLDCSPFGISLTAVTPRSFSSAATAPGFVPFERSTSTVAL